MDELLKNEYLNPVGCCCEGRSSEYILSASRQNSLCGDDFQLFSSDRKDPGSHCFTGHMCSIAKVSSSLMIRTSRKIADPVELRSLIGSQVLIKDALGLFSILEECELLDHETLKLIQHFSDELSKFPTRNSCAILPWQAYLDAVGG